MGREAALLWGLEAGRLRPIVQMGGYICSTSFLRRASRSRPRGSLVACSATFLDKAASRSRRPDSSSVDRVTAGRSKKAVPWNE